MTTPHDDEDHALDLTLLAIQEQFLEEWRAGKRPRLSVYAVRYPQYSAALADLVLQLEPDTLATASEREQRPPEPVGERILHGAGAQRALEALFGAAPADDQLPRVAEQPASYDTRADPSTQPPTPSDPSDD